jgi:DNA adenine methylase
MKRKSFTLEPNLSRPIVKWAGGKTELVPALLPEVPETIRTYVEPFAGGAALFFALSSEEPRRFEKAKLNDRNAELVACYRAVKADVDALVTRLGGYSYDKELYYRVRDVETRDLDDVERGARLIFLNRTCFNGLWRENSKGKFNVPFGTYKNPRILDEMALRRAAVALSDVSLTNLDFEDACKRLGEGDFVYFDPPYVPVSKTASFTAYQASGFGRDDHRRLADLLTRLAKKGVKAMLSNADNDETRELYRAFRCKRVGARRSISALGSGRGKAGELVVTNFGKPGLVKEKNP